MRPGSPYNPLIGNEVLEAHKRLSKIIGQSGVFDSIAAQSALSKIGAGIAPSALAGLSPVFVRIREQQASMLAGLAPLFESQTRLKELFTPLAEQIAGMQLGVASSINVAVLASAQWQSNIAKLAVGSEVGEALQRITELASMRLALPTTDGFSRLADLIDAGEVAEELLSEAEEGVAADAELSEAIDRAADALAASRPFISRDRARQIIVFWVWLMYGAGLWAVAVFGGPALVAVPAALGAPAAPQAARAVADRLIPREEEDES